MLGFLEHFVLKLAAGTEPTDRHRQMLCNAQRGSQDRVSQNNWNIGITGCTAVQSIASTVHTTTQIQQYTARSNQSQI